MMNHTHDGPFTVAADPDLPALICAQRRVDETRYSDAQRIAIVQGMWDRLDDLMLAVPDEFTCGDFGSYVADLKERAAAAVLTAEQYANLDWNAFWAAQVIIIGGPDD